MRRYSLYNNIHCTGRVAAAANSFVVVVIAIGVFRSRSHARQISYIPDDDDKPTRGLMGEGQKRLLLGKPLDEFIIYYNRIESHPSLDVLLL